MVLQDLLLLLLPGRFCSAWWRSWWSRPAEWWWVLAEHNAVETISDRPVKSTGHLCCIFAVVPHFVFFANTFLHVANNSARSVSFFLSVIKLLLHCNWNELMFLLVCTVWLICDRSWFNIFITELLVSVYWCWHVFLTVALCALLAICTHCLLQCTLHINILLMFSLVPKYF